CLVRGKPREAEEPLEILIPIDPDVRSKLESTHRTSTPFPPPIRAITRANPARFSARRADGRPSPAPSDPRTGREQPMPSPPHAPLELPPGIDFSVSVGIGGRNTVKREPRSTGNSVVASAARVRAVRAMRAAADATDDTIKAMLRTWSRA